MVRRARRRTIGWLAAVAMLTAGCELVVDAPGARFVEVAPDAASSRAAASPARATSSAGPSDAGEGPPSTMEGGLAEPRDAGPDAPVCACDARVPPDTGADAPFTLTRPPRFDLPGARWVYHVRNASGVHTMTRRVTDVSHLADGGYTSRVRSEGESVQTLSIHADARGYALGRVGAMVLQPPLPRLQTPAGSGAAPSTHTAFDDDGSAHVIRTEVLGTDSVVVPAGRFHALLERTLWLRDGHMVARAYSWWADEVGVVLDHAVDLAGRWQVRRLVSWERSGAVDARAPDAGAPDAGAPAAGAPDAGAYDDVVACDAPGCGTFQVCSTTDGSDRCSCMPGFVPDGHRCMDIDECTRNPASCKDGQRCRNLIGHVACISDSE